MSDIEMYLERWRQDVCKSSQQSAEDNYKSNMIFEEWKPRWNWFRPPMWRIFRWAYKISYKLFTGVYPVSMKTTTNDEKVDDIPELSVTFSCARYLHNAIEELAEKKAKEIKKWMEEQRIDLSSHVTDVSKSEKKEEDGCSST